MSATPAASAVSIEKEHCLLCNEVISTEAYDDVKKGGLNKLKKLSEQWAKVEDIFCCDKPYKEFRYAHSCIEVIIIITPVFLLKVFPIKFCLK